MSKIFTIRFFFFITVALLFFNSCLKDKGQPKPAPFDLSEVQGFESSANLPSGWTLYNPDNDAAWQVVTTVSKSGNNCVGFNNCSGDGTIDMTGTRDRLITPSYDFTNATSASISFDVAYAFLNFHNTKPFPDTLVVFSSIDNGSTWNQIYIKGADSLSNIPTITSNPPSQLCWAPDTSTTDDWRTDYISLNNLAGKAHVKFAFENRSGWGEWIYLDNISINASNSNCEGITYLKDIQPIIQNQCATSGCHVPGGESPTDLNSYSGIKAVADNGKLKQRALDGSPSFMPVSGRLPESMINKIRCWLDAGAPNN